MINKSNLIVCIIIFAIILKANPLNAQIVGNNAYVKGKYIEFGINGTGGYEGVNKNVNPPPPGYHFRSSDSLFGFVANPQKNNWATFDGDFFTPALSENGWGFEIDTNGIKGSNNANRSPQYKVNDIKGNSITYNHSLDCYNIDWEGDYTSNTNLHFKINYFLQEYDLFYTTTVSITNKTTSPIPDMYYYRSVDPDNNVIINNGDYTTDNVIIKQPGVGGCVLAHVTAKSGNPTSQPFSYLGFAGAGANWRATFGGTHSLPSTINRDASDIWYGTNKLSQSGSEFGQDHAISLAYRIQNLNPGETRTFKFVVILGSADAPKAINSVLYFTYPGSSNVPPDVCTAVIDTVNTCGNPVPISVEGYTVDEYIWTWNPSIGLNPFTGATTIANPSVTTVYTVSGTPKNPQCMPPVSLKLAVKVSPDNGSSTPVINPVPALCKSDTPYQLTANAPFGKWSGKGITSNNKFDPAISGAGVFQIAYNVSNACNSTDTVLIAVNGDLSNEFSYPYIYVLDTMPTLPILAAGFPTGGTYTSSNGLVIDSTTGVINGNASTPGTYTVIYDVYDPTTTCFASGNSIVSISQVPAGILNSEKMKTKIEVYPNPAKDIVNFTINLQGEIIQYILVKDMLGKSIMHVDGSTLNQNQFNLKNNIPEGIYFLEITTDKRQYNQKFSVLK